MVKAMQKINATDVRKNWSVTCDEASHVRPTFIKRTHDSLFLSSAENMLSLLSPVVYKCTVYEEEDGSYTISSHDLGLVENAASKDEAVDAMALSILDYAEEYYENYSLYSKAPNRTPHLPYITKALLLSKADLIKEAVVCQNGEN